MPAPKITKDSNYWYCEGYQAAMNDLALKLAETDELRSMLVWCQDNARRDASRMMFAEFLRLYDAAEVKP